MSTTLTPQPAPVTPATPRTMADLLEQLGDLAPRRVLVDPPPGTATEQDLIEAEQRGHRLCELVDGVLVEKAMGYSESLLAGFLLTLLRGFVDPRNLGLVTGPDGMMRLFPGLVRLPDVAFVSWASVPGRRVPKVPCPDLVPDLAVEVLSEGNTVKEMARKRREYFDAGVRLLWIVDGEARTVTVFTALDQFQTLGATQTLDGGDVLPGFAVALSTLFAELDREGPQET